MNRAYGQVNDYWNPMVVLKFEHLALLRLRRRHHLLEAPKARDSRSVLQGYQFHFDFFGIH